MLKYKNQYKFKLCTICGSEFQQKSGVHKYCSETCKGKAKYILGTVSTESQYNSISGNWYRYFARLIGRSRDRGELSVNELLRKLELQNYKCALSDVPLTCLLEKGTKFKTNASIDRIKAGEPYTNDNIQLVCAAVNSWRADTDLDEFIWFCKQITEWQEKEGRVRALHD